MPLPRWLAKVTKYVFNPRSLKKGSYPVMTHIGRKSGQERKTPLDAFPFTGGFVFLVNYDSTKADWVLNIMKAGRSSLLFEGDTYELTSPRIVPKAEAEELTDERFKPPPNWMNVEFLAMDVAEGSGGSW